jgi:hypothetical protein
MVPSIQPLVPLQYIQSIRLVHALAETSHPVALPERERQRFAILTRRLGARFVPVTPATRPLHGLRLTHPAPETRIGRIVRPLVFPHAVADRCRHLWDTERPVPFAFAGLVTDRRLSLMRGWIARNIDLPRPWQPATAGRLHRAWDRLRNRLGHPPAGRSQRLGPLLLWSSERGRVFPWKAWDEDYFALLGRSRFVLCPSGDFVWSYRFFEAALCGAIPVVEESCPAYDGFRFHSFADDARQLVWRAEDAEANYRLARERLTVPAADLEAEIAHLLASAPATA